MLRELLVFIGYYLLYDTLMQSVPPWIVAVFAELSTIFYMEKDGEK